MRAKIKRGIRKNNHEHFYGGFVNESNQQTILWYNSNSRASLSPGGGHKVYRHEQSQNAQLRQLQSLEGRTDYLEQRLQQVTEYYNVQPEYRDDAYNYLAIGNSLTLITNWGRGICATQPDGDYFGRVKQQLATEHGDAVAYRINYASWERMQDLSKALDLLDIL